MLKKILKRNAIDHMLWGWVCALRAEFPSASVDQAIRSFLKHNDPHEEQLTFDAARMTFYRMQKEYLEAERSEG